MSNIVFQYSFRGTYASIFRAAVCSYEMLVSTNKCKRRYKPEEQLLPLVFTQCL
jgi:hypothetical protein